MFGKYLIGCIVVFVVIFSALFLYLVEFNESGVTGAAIVEGGFVAKPIPKNTWNYIGILSVVAVIGGMIVKGIDKKNNPNENNADGGDFDFGI